MPTDPVCGMYVPDDSSIYSLQDGQKYLFCSKECQYKYESPEKAAITLRRRLIVSWPLAVSIILITYLVPSSFTDRNYILLLLTLPVQFYSGNGFYDGAYHSILGRTANMDLLVSMGTLTAFFFSAYITLLPGTIPSSDVYYDASAFIITLILTGNFIENKTKIRANKAAGKLIGIIPGNTTIINENGETSEVPTGQVKPGNLIVVKPGEIIPVDGEIFQGRSDIDESMLTGEQEPVTREAPDPVSSGTKNLNGLLKIKVTRTGRDSTVNQIYELIQRAASGRAKVQRVADAFSSVFVPIVIVTAISASLFWYFYLSSIGYGFPLVIAVLAFVSVVVIACPCAIGLAGPITLLLSSDISYENGIIIKNSSALDRLSRANRAIFDKTGTLTEPEPAISQFTASPEYSHEQALSIAASLESSSNHPVAKAIVKMAKEKGVKMLEVSDVEEMPGKGIRGRVQGKNIEIIRKKKENGSTVAVMIDNNEAGIFELTYRIRENAADAVKQLKAMGIGVSMITGDSYGEARRVGSEIGIEDIHAEVMPSQKAEIIKEYQMKGDYVIFTGDGINDSIALETADVGIAMASGTDIARESGDIILLNNDLMHVVYAKIIGNRTIGKVKQNIGWAFGYNTALIPIAAGVLVPFAGLSIYSFLPILSALAMGMSSSSVVMNSLLLRGKINRSLEKLNAKG